MRTLLCRLTAALAIGSASLLATQSAEAAIVVLQNDGFVDNANVGFQTGFASGEQAAVTLGPVAESFTINKVMLLFGPAGGLQTVTLRIFQDTGSTAPGTQVFSADYQLTPAGDAMQEIDLSADNIQLGPGLFRVSVEFQHSGSPSVARDDDGSITAGRNWINAQGVGWIGSAQLGLTGDWVMRAEINTMGGGTTTATGATTGSGTTSGAGGGTGSGTTGGGSVCTPGTTQECVGPGACQGGQSCNADGTGFSACECAGDPAGDADGGGCSASSSDSFAASGGFAGLGLLGLGALLRLRRKRAVKN